MIIVPKLRIAEAELGTNTGLSGRFMMTKYKAGPDGNPILASAVVVADWFDNIITNQGLNRIGTAIGQYAYCHVGSGTAAPQATDTGLQSFVAGAGRGGPSGGFSAQTTPPYFGATTIGYRFNAGTATGNLSEVGVGWAASGAVLFSRALIRDGSGNPTTITVLSDEVLDVVYQLRVYPPSSDVLGQIAVTGVGNINTTTRAANVTSSSAWAPDNVGTLAGIGTSRLHTGAIGLITGSPSGGVADAVTVTNNSYSNNSFQLTAVATWDLSAVLSARSLLFTLRGSSWGCWGQMQVEFDTIIPKTGSNTLSLNLTHSWARRAI